MGIFVILLAITALGLLLFKVCFDAYLSKLQDFFRWIVIIASTGLGAMFVMFIISFCLNVAIIRYQYPNAQTIVQKRRVNNQILESRKHYNNIWIGVFYSRRVAELELLAN